MKKLLFLSAIAAAIAIALTWWVWRPGLAPLAADASLDFDARNIAKGAELTTLGNCSDCHTMAGGASYAGGRPVETPFGTVYASNLTPDRETGIGAWSEEAFRRAMREGVDREGRDLYPAFPYDHFTVVTDEDVKAIYAFLMSRTAVSNSVPQTELDFPYNIRFLVAGWKLLFLHQNSLAPDPSQSEEWNRGRYLVEGLGHCGSCHTPRNVLGAEERGSLYAGGAAGGWHAPALNASLVKIHNWSIDQLADYLATGWNRQHGVAAGPMADVAQNLGRVSRDEVRAIATYVVSLSDGGVPTKADIAPEGKPLIDQPPEIVAIYDGACARCHNDRAEVGPSLALTLTLSTSVHGAGSGNVVRAIMNGIQAYRSDGGPYMPGFDRMLSDTQIIALTRYVRARYSDQPQWTDIEAEVAKARQEGAQP